MLFVSDESESDCKQYPTFFKTINVDVVIAKCNYTSPSPITESSQINNKVNVFMLDSNAHLKVGSDNDDTKVVTDEGRNNDPRIRTEALGICVKKLGAHFVLHGKHHAG